MLSFIILTTAEHQIRKLNSEYGIAWGLEYVDPQLGADFHDGGITALPHA